jgi:hypothetical protein
MHVLITLVVAVLIVLLIKHNIGVRKRWAERCNVLAAWAASNNMPIAQGRTQEIERGYCTDFPSLRTCGDDRYAYNVMKGKLRGRDFCFFDYHYQTTTTNEKGETTTTDWNFSAVVVSSEVPLKPLYIRPENAADKVKAFFGADDINFESKEFSAKYYVSSPDKRWAYDVLHPRTIEFLLGMPLLYINFATHNVMVSASKMFDVSMLIAATDVACGILERLPEYLIRQQKEGG